MGKQQKLEINENELFCFVFDTDDCLIVYG
jgi:hypothetical protein